MKYKKLLAGLGGFALCVQLVGCATIPEAIEYRNLYTNYKMSDTIFLDVTKKSKYKNIFIDVKNTSQLQEVDPEGLRLAIAENLRGKGYNVLPTPDNADYILQVNILYFDYYRKTAAREAAGEGALGGATLGAGVGTGGGKTEALILAALGAGAGYVGGALVGSAIKIETFAGVVDIQILEKAENPVIGKLITSAKQGSVTTLQTEQAIQTNYQTYRTQLAVVATQTNLKRDEAAKEVTNMLAKQIGGIF
ncbi:MAG: complement resistance protein TraT [Candidatus Aenigmatarchaeota archaeon]